MEDQIFSYLFALFLGLIAAGIAWRVGFFQSIQLNFIPNIRGTDVLIGFGCYIFFEILFVPGLIGFVLRFISDNSAEMVQNNEQFQGWMHVWIILGGIAAVVLSSLALTATQRRQLWNQTKTSWFVHIGIGIIAWLICYPFVLVLHEGITLFLHSLFDYSTEEQVVVQNMRQFLQYPILFGALAPAVIILVPLTEEFLFRGLLQSWLKQKLLSPLWSILLSSGVFAFFHYSSQLGLSNIPLLSSLFLLSCMLGYLYERQHSLWASIGLHSFFNFMSLFLLTQVQ